MFDINVTCVHMVFKKLCVALAQIKMTGVKISELKTTRKDNGVLSTQALT